MPYIYEQAGWPKLRWDIEKLALLLADIRQQQGFLLGKMAMLGFNSRQEASLETLTADVIKSSAIEGERLNYEQVRSSLARKLDIDTVEKVPVNRHVEGVVEMMLDATQHYQRPLTEERLFQWHQMLFPSKQNSLRDISVGKWRTDEGGPMQVVSGRFGRETVHYEAPPAKRVAEEMEVFLEWFNQTLSIDPILKAGVAHLWFVTIHPFEDGNGRIARAIADLALTRADNSKERFYSMSTQIEKDREQYYWHLERTQKGDVDITDWLEWFLNCLARALENSDHIVHHVIQKANIWDTINQYAINERQRKVINRLLDGFVGNLTSSKYAKVAKCSQDTALRDIQELLGYGIFVKNAGGGRSTSYSLSH